MDHNLSAGVIHPVSMPHRAQSLTCRSLPPERAAMALQACGIELHVGQEGQRRRPGPWRTPPQATKRRYSQRTKLPTSGTGSKVGPTKSK
jgi:hypothetical protein